MDLIRVKFRIVTSEAGGNEKEVTVNGIIKEIASLKIDINISHQTCFR